jgi:hypothetical protein
MRYLLFFILIGFLLSSSCGGGGYNTKPTLSFKTIAPNPVAPLQEFQVQAEYTDKEGDLSEDSFYLRVIRLNRRSYGPNPPAIYTGIYVKLPEFPKQPKGIIRYLFTGNVRNQVNPPNTENDTVVFRCAVRDQKGNWSDSITSAPVVIRR